MRNVKFEPDIEEFIQKYEELSRKELLEHYKVGNSSILRMITNLDLPNKAMIRKPVQTPEQISLSKEKEKNRRKRAREKRDSDPVKKLRKKTSDMIWLGFKRGGVKKPKGIWSHLSYTPEQMKIHIESQFEPWMNWSNQTNSIEPEKGWNLDHIIPQSVLPYTSVEDENFKKCWALSNLRPLDSVLNVSKSDKMLDLPQAQVKIDSSSMVSILPVMNLKLNINKEQFIEQIMVSGSKPKLAEHFKVSQPTIYRFSKKFEVNIRDYLPLTCIICRKKKRRDCFDYQKYDAMYNRICFQCK